MKKEDCSQPQLGTPLFLSLHDILKKEIRKKSYKLMKKDLNKSGLD
jgi:hypothetical protein